MAKDLKELMNAYDTMRARWIAEMGSDAGFNDWFAAKLMGQEAGA